MSLVEDAIKVLTDPATPSSFGTGGMRAIDSERVIATFRERGTSDVDARAAALEALDQLGGKVERSMHAGGAGRQRQQAVEVWLVPQEALRR